MELKCHKYEASAMCSHSFNRTIMELKCVKSLITFTGTGSAFNRTIMELK